LNINYIEQIELQKLMLLNNNKSGGLVFKKNLTNDVAIIKLFPGITEKVIEALINIRGLKGIVLETYGAGNAPTKKWFVDLLKKTIDKGIHIVNVTQCYGGSVILGMYETSAELKSIGIINGKDITTESALAKMMYLLNENLPQKAFKEYFETSIRGEIS